jgi:hypothetical protein
MEDIHDFNYLLNSKYSADRTPKWHNLQIFSHEKKVVKCLSKSSSKMSTVTSNGWLYEWLDVCTAQITKLRGNKIIYYHRGNELLITSSLDVKVLKYLSTWGVEMAFMTHHQNPNFKGVHYTQWQRGTHWSCFRSFIFAFAFWYQRTRFNKITHKQGPKCVPDVDFQWEIFLGLRRRSFL